jgi:hypothetical protein
MEAAPALVKADESLLGEIRGGAGVTSQKTGEALQISVFVYEVAVEVRIAPSKLHLS